MNDLTVFEQDGKLLTDSREVAFMVEKPHNDLMKSIRGYCKNLNEGEISPVEFFVESTYIDSKGEERPCYLCTKNCIFKIKRWAIREILSNRGVKPLPLGMGI